MLKLPNLKYKKTLLLKRKVNTICHIICILIACASPLQMLPQHYIDSLYQALPKQKDIKRVEVLCEIAKAIRSIHADSAKTLAEEALMIAKQVNSPFHIAESYNALGGSNLFRGDLQAAIEQFKMALLHYDNLDEKLKKADMLNNLGVAHRKIGKYEVAIKYYLKALEIKEKIAEKSETISLLNNIGSIYYYQKNYKKAETYYLRVEELAAEQNDRSLLSVVLNNLSLIAFEQHDYGKSLSLITASLTIRKELGDIQGQATAYSNIGRIYLIQHNIHQALFHFIQALDKYKKIGDQFGIANILFNIGSAHIELKEHKKALTFLLQSTHIADSLGDVQTLRDSYKNMAECYRNLGEHSNAYKYLNAFVILNDSLINEENLRLTAELEAQYESARKETEITLLKQEKLIQEKDIEKQEAELNKQRLFRNSLMAGIGLAVIIIALIIFQYIQKQKANKVLSLQNEEINKQKKLVEEKSEELQEKNNEITGSILYAKRIQQAIFPPQKHLSSFLPESFIFFQPKDIVSGDFYWLQPHPATPYIFYVAAVDCTGHGVPGAFMSIVGNNLLNDALKVAQKTNVADILNELDKNIRTYLHHETGSAVVNDSMDIAICALDKEKNTLTYAGAYNDLYMFREGKLHIIKADIKPIGSVHHTDINNFKQHEIPLQKNDVFYIFSDGYADQFGGPKGKKFKSSQFSRLLQEIHTQELSSQRDILQQHFDEWKGSLEQVDDVLVIGFKV